MAAYNSEKYIAESIQSVFNQSFSDWELIVSDDASTDKTCEIVENFQEKDSRILLLKSDKNQGAAVTRNRAIEKAQGRYIAFLDSDDLWHPEKLARQVAFMEKNHVAFSFHAYSMYSEDWSQKLIDFQVPEKVSYRELLYSNVISMCAAVYDQKLLGAKIYMPLILKRQDYGLFLNILKKIECAYSLPDDLLKVRIHSQSLSANKWKAAQYQWKLYREVEKFNLFKTLYYFFFYATKGIRKYILKA